MNTYPDAMAQKAMIRQNISVGLKRKAKAVKVICIILSIFIILVGLFSIFGSVVMLNTWGYYFRDYDSMTTRYTSYKSYGGDAYTGIQNAAADISYNVVRVGENLQEEIVYATDAVINKTTNTIGQGFGWILLVLGLLIFFVGILLCVKFSAIRVRVDQALLTELVEEEFAKSMLFRVGERAPYQNAPAREE